MQFWDPGCTGARQQGLQVREPQRSQKSLGRAAGKRRDPASLLAIPVSPGAQGPSAHEKLFPAEKARRGWRCCCCRASHACRSPPPSPSSRLLSKASRLRPGAHWSHQPDPATLLASLRASVGPGLGDQPWGGAAAWSQAASAVCLLCASCRASDAAKTSAKACLVSVGIFSFPFLFLFT